MHYSRFLKGAAVAASLAAGSVFACNTASAQVYFGGGYGPYPGYGLYAGYGAGYYGGPLAWGADLIADTVGLGLTAATAPLAAAAWGYPGGYGYPGYGYYGYGQGYGYYPSVYGYGAGYGAYPYYASRHVVNRYAYGYGRGMMRGHRYYRGYYTAAGPRLRSAVYTGGARHGRTMIRHHRAVRGKMIHAKYIQRPVTHYRVHVARQAQD